MLGPVIPDLKENERDMEVTWDSQGKLCVAFVDPVSLNGGSFFLSMCHALLPSSHLNRRF